VDASSAKGSSELSRREDRPIVDIGTGESDERRHTREHSVGEARCGHRGVVGGQDDEGNVRDLERLLASDAVHTNDLERVKDINRTGVAKVREKKNEVGLTSWNVCWLWVDISPNTAPHCCEGSDSREGEHPQGYSLPRRGRAPLILGAKEEGAMRVGRCWRLDFLDNWDV
jgi:hypothetical protein